MFGVEVCVAVTNLFAFVRRPSARAFGLGGLLDAAMHFTDKLSGRQQQAMTASRLHAGGLCN